MTNLTPEEFSNLVNQPNKQGLTGIARALRDYKVEVAKLHTLPVTADCLLESIEAERLFRKTITEDLRTLIELNCTNCPMGYTKNSCEQNNCPFSVIDKILNQRLKELNSILPGGIQ